MCTQVTMKDLVTAHHELTHIQYFLQYRNQPKVYRDGANPGIYYEIHVASNSLNIQKNSFKYIM